LVLIDDRDWRLVERLGQRICRGIDRARKRKGGYASALLGFEPKDGFSYEIRSGHCCSGPISDGAELGLSRGEFVKRLGYKNIAKGIRRIDVLCDGDLEGTKHFLDVLPQALETSAETVKLALEQTVREIELAEKQEAEARDKNLAGEFLSACHHPHRADRAEPDFCGSDDRRRETPSHRS
jgi:hypothetical protein